MVTFDMIHHKIHQKISILLKMIFLFWPREVESFRGANPFNFGDLALSMSADTMVRSNDGDSDSQWPGSNVVVLFGEVRSGVCRGTQALGGRMEAEWPFSEAPIHGGQVTIGSGQLGLLSSSKVYLGDGDKSVVQDLISKVFAAVSQYYLDVSDILNDCMTEYSPSSYPVATKSNSLVIEQYHSLLFREDHIYKINQLMRGVIEAIKIQSNDLLLDPADRNYIRYNLKQLETVMDTQVVVAQVDVPNVVLCDCIGPVMGSRMGGVVDSMPDGAEVGIDDVCSICNGAIQQVSLTSYLSNKTLSNINCNQITMIDYNDKGEEVKRLVNADNYTPDVSRHFDFWIEHLQGVESRTFLESDLQRIQYVIRRDNYEKCELTLESMRKILKDSKVKLTKLNDSATLLIKIFGGIPPPQLNYSDIQIVQARFFRIMKLYDIIISSGGNKPYYPYFLYKIFESLFENNKDKLRILNYIHLQSRKTVIKNDRIYKQICEISDDNDKLVYIPTIAKI